MSMALHYCLFDTAIGPCGIAWSERGVRRLQLPQADRAMTEEWLRRLPASGPAEPPPATQHAIDLVKRYLDGERIDFSDVAVDLTGVDDFRLSIYDELRRVGWGETTTYGELARRIGAPGGAQGVGQAMGRNPTPVIIPCHRVLAAGHKAGGFSAYGGTITKHRLLALEGVSIEVQPLLPGL